VDVYGRLLKKKRKRKRMPLGAVRKSPLFRHFSNADWEVIARNQAALGRVVLDEDGDQFMRESFFVHLCVQSMGKDYMVKQRQIDQIRLDAQTQFRLLDVDHSGTISLEELRAAPLFETLDDEEMRKMIQWIDVNGDNRVDEEEFVENSVFVQAGDPDVLPNKLDDKVGRWLEY
jgi:hypothetical protein